MKNLKRNSLLTISLLVFATPLISQGIFPSDPVDLDKTKEIVFSPTVDPENGRSTLFYNKQDLNTLDEMGSAVEALVEAKVRQSQRKTLSYAYFAFLLALALAVSAFLSHESQYPYKT